MMAENGQVFERGAELDERRPVHLLGVVRRAGLIDQLEFGREAVGPGVLQKSADRIRIQVLD